MLAPYSLGACRYSIIFIPYSDQAILKNSFNLPAPTALTYEV